MLHPPSPSMTRLPSVKKRAKRIEASVFVLLASRLSRMYIGTSTCTGIRTQRAADRSNARYTAYGVRYYAYTEASRVSGLRRADAGVAKAAEGPGEPGLGSARKPVSNPNPTRQHRSWTRMAVLNLKSVASPPHPAEFVLLILSTASRKRKLIPGPGDFLFF